MLMLVTAFCTQITKSPPSWYQGSPSTRSSSCLHPPPDGILLPLDSSTDDAHYVHLKSGQMYKHQLLINYTTYNVRRSQDTISPNTPRCDIMLLADDSEDDSHPFQYARVLGVFHVNGHV
jgi:hypothetical protein